MKYVLNAEGRRLEFWGWGIKYNAGDREQELERRIVESGGLLVSLWKDQMGTNWTFPARNQVVADICHELIVVEAAVKSGGASNGRNDDKAQKNGMGGAGTDYVFCVCGGKYADFYR